MIVYEMNTRLHRRTFDRISDADLRAIAALGFTWIWTMGIWRIGPKAVTLSRRYGEDFEGSPYAIAAYEVDPALGGDAAFDRFVARAHAAGLHVMVDFVPNHLSFDSPLIDEHPAWVIHSNPSVREEYAVDYFDHAKGRLAHGKDPHFSGWVDTVQLDYAHPELRAHMASELARIASRADGVRCDMAMLILRRHFKRTWFPSVDQALFDQHFDREFWADAIPLARSKNPDFVLMAEVYWDEEAALQELGFDLTYDKRLYDLVAYDPPEAIAHHLADKPERYHRRSVHFLENHDEERAAVRFGRRTKPAAILSFALPGAPFVHEGQMDGFTEKLPVQRRAPLERETPDASLRAFYEHLLAIIKHPIFREGRFLPLGTQHGAVLYARALGGEVVLVAADVTGSRPSESPAFEVPLHRLGLGDHARVRAVDRWTGRDVCAHVEDGRLRLDRGAVPSFAESGAFMLGIEA